MDNPHLYLYRGVSEVIHQKGEALHPRGTSFNQFIVYGTGFKYGSGVKYGQSPVNAAIKHQVDSLRFPTAGISTTPLIERAKYYALGGNKFKKGFVYKIDRQKAQLAQITEWHVSEYAKISQVPEDDEHILVSHDNGALPKDIVIEIIEVERAERDSKES